jgi:hypothetical protein
MSSDLSSQFLKFLKAKLCPAVSGGALEILSHCANQHRLNSRSLASGGLFDSLARRFEVSDHFLLCFIELTKQKLIRTLEPGDHSLGAGGAAQRRAITVQIAREATIELDHHQREGK